MTRLLVLRDGVLTLPKELLEATGLRGDETMVATVVNGQLLLRPLSAAGVARQRLMEHLSLPVGSLAHQVPQPEKPVTVEDELGGDLYADID